MIELLGARFEGFTIYLYGVGYWVFILMGIFAIYGILCLIKKIEKQSQQKVKENKKYDK